jgi:Flp pilus assembly protein TadG
VRLRRSRAKNRATAARGQSLAEFALVFPLFWTVVIGLIEFSFGFQSVLAVSFASRNAAVIASEAGNAPTADCSILRSVENDLTAPSSARQILTVDIYWTDSNGVLKPGATTTYTRSALSTTNCKVDNVSFTVPYGTPSPNGYPMGTRCSQRAGCPSYLPSHAGSTGLDTVGVKLTYRYLFHTPYSAILGGTGWTLERSSEMRLEPFQ